MALASTIPWRYQPESALSFPRPGGQEAADEQIPEALLLGMEDISGFLSPFAFLLALDSVPGGALVSDTVLGYQARGAASEGTRSVPLSA